MTPNTLKNWYNDRSYVYERLARECGSVAELVLKIDVMGETWTRWDWAFFFNFVDWHADMGDCCEEKPVSSLGTHASADELNTVAKRLIRDILDEIDGGDLLDSVVTNRTVVMNMITLTESSSFYSHGIYRLLAHVFKKFPSMWNMNWMYVRHRGANKRQPRTHRLRSAVAGIKRRDEYYESDAFRQDFVYRYFRRKR